MTIEEEIKQRVQQAFAPDYMELVNESYKHAGHAGDNGTGQTHFLLIIVSDVFQECSRIQRQQKVYANLQTLFSKGLHALSMRLYTVEEYRAAQ